jgi:predicted ATPase/class 3 adenylate cyclase
VNDSAVTYLFSDVEGSTRLWETEPERMGPALARHDELAREAVARHGGRVVKMTGDGLHAAFDDPVAALTAAVDIQLAVGSPPEGVLPLALRCGLHLGVDQRRDGDFFGPAVNRAARVMSAAHGGQVLLTQAVAERVRERLPAGAALRDLGLARLRDLASAEQLFQLVHPQLRSEFPALRSLASTPNNLPQQVNSFVGRLRELDEVRAMLGYPTVRLLTLLGMGGLGKSRLSLQAAAEVLDDFPDGVWFVELAPLSDPRSVPQAVASVLGVKEEGGGAVLDALLRYLRDKTLLIVLDNCEHVVQACAELAQRVLQSAPAVKLLASSRDALQTAGETVVHVPPLAAPDAGATITPGALAQIDAVRLFIDRATAAQPAFRVTDKNAAAVASICRRLDGIPLALELAAARTRAMTVEAIAARLDDRFKLLVTGDRTVLPRQRTLRALIDWSYDLLPARERQLFARLSVFAGGCTLEAAEAVGAGGAIEAADVLDLLAELVQKSLVMMDVDGGRYRMLDTVRQYAAQRLDQAGEAAAVHERHLEYFAGLVERARGGLFGAEQSRVMAQLDEERDNTLAAHAWCGSSSQGAALDLQMVYGLKFYWLNRGLLDLGLRVAKEALGRTGAAQRTLARSRGLSDAGQICYFMGRYAEARTLLEESLAIARELGHPLRRVAVLQILSMVEFALGEAAQAQLHGEEALRLARELAQPHVIAGTLNNLAQLHRARGACADALRLFEEALAIARTLDDQETIAVALLNRAMALIEGGQPDAVPPLLEEALSIASLTGSRAVGQSLLEVTSGLAAARGDWTACATFYGAAEAQAQRSGLRRDPADALFLAHAIGRSRAADGGSAAAEAAGRALVYDTAMTALRGYLLPAEVRG